METYLSLAKEHQGVYRCEVAKLAFELNISPFTIPKILYNLQEQGKQEISYEVDQEAFVLRMEHLPQGGDTLGISQEMLAETRRIERNMV